MKADFSDCNWPECLSEEQHDILCKSILAEELGLPEGLERFNTMCIRNCEAELKKLKENGNV